MLNLYSISCNLRVKLDAVRDYLDTEMYHSGDVDPESEDFKKVRAVYDAICKVEDML